MKKIAAITLLLLANISHAQVKAVSCSRFALSDNENYKCGTMNVPYDHFKRSEGLISISFVVIDQHEHSQLTPLVILTGGPGGSAITQSRVNHWFNSPLSDNRAVILFDQRGTGYSSPLKNINNEFSSLFRKNLRFDQERVEVKKLMKSYASHANQLGVDLSLYNSFQSAHDLNLIMENLGYEKYNLYGSSYGTRLGRVVQELFPERLNAVVFNSPNPLNGGDMLLGRLESYSKSLQRLFAYCENNLECSSKHPNLENTYFNTIRSLDKNPLKLKINDRPYYVNAEEGLYFIRRLLYRNTALIDVPLLIDELGGHGDQLLVHLINNEFKDSYNYAMWFAVERYEMFNAYVTEEVIDAMYENSSSFPVKLAFFTSVYLHLSYFHEKTIEARKKNLKKSNVPTLITVNQYDPVTPPEDAYRMAESLNNFKLFVLNQAGHGGGNQACRNQVMRQFLEKPTAKLDTDCLDIIN